MNRYVVRLLVDHDEDGKPLEEDEIFVNADDFEITDGGGLIFSRKMGQIMNKCFGVAPESWVTVERIEVS